MTGVQTCALPICHDLVTGTAAFSVTWGSGAFAGAMIAGWSMAVFGADGLPYTIAAVMALSLVVAMFAASSRRS